MAFRKLTPGNAAMFNPANLGNASGVASPPSTAAGVSGDTGGMSGAGGGAGNWASNIKNLQVIASQADCNEKAGRLLAASNYKYVELRITSPANYLGAFDIIPSIGFYQWGLADALFKRGLGLNGKKLICRNVTANMVEGGVMQTSVVFEIEAIGENGIPGNYPAGYPTPVTTQPVNGPSSVMGTYGAFIVVYEGSLVTAFVKGDKTVQVSVTVAAGNFATKSKKVVVLSTTKALVASITATNNFVGYVLDITGSTITPNAADTYDADANDCVSLSKISTTHILAGYVIGGLSYFDAMAMVIEVSGSSSSGGAPITLNADGGSNISVTTLSGTKGLSIYVKWKNIGVESALYGRVLTISGTTVSMGASYEIGGSFASEVLNSLGVISLSDTLAVCAYKADDGKMYGIAMSISGNVINPDSATEIFAAAEATQTDNFIVKISSTVFVIATQDSIVACSVAGTTITVGAPKAFAGTQPVVSYYNGYVTMVYADGLNVLQRRTFSISGTTLTDLADATTNSETYPNGSGGGGIYLVS